jgi:hypothetical protein
MCASGSAQVRGRRVAAKFTSASSSVPKPRACWAVRASKVACELGTSTSIASLFLLLLLRVLRSFKADRSASYIASNMSGLSNMAYGTALLLHRLSGPHPFSLLRRKDQPHGYHPPIILPLSMSLATNTISVPVSFVFLSKPFHHVDRIQQQQQQQQQQHLPHHVGGSHTRTTMYRG